MSLDYLNWRKTEDETGGRSEGSVGLPHGRQNESPGALWVCRHEKSGDFVELTRLPPLKFTLQTRIGSKQCSNATSSCFVRNKRKASGGSNGEIASRIHGCSTAECGARQQVVGAMRKREKLPSFESASGKCLQ